MSDTPTTVQRPTMIPERPKTPAARGDAAYEPFNGKLHAAGAWDRALSAAEVAALHAWLAAR